MVGSGIRKKPIPDPGSRGQKGTGSRIRIRNTGYWYCHSVAIGLELYKFLKFTAKRTVWYLLT
jgi:hypothetical protein